jgi:hypothetical protein
MAELGPNLWEYNLARVIIVDVTDDYRLMQKPMPSDFYPVLKEVWLPRHCLKRGFADDDLMDGYLYDWHETPDNEFGSWYVGVVDQNLASV